VAGDLPEGDHLVRVGVAGDLPEGDHQGVVRMERKTGLKTDNF
jgi:hypothetical protein